MSYKDYIETYKDKKVRLIVAGSRGFSNRKYCYNLLDHLLQKYEPKDVVILDGGAKGADKFGGDYGRLRGIDVWDFPADWKDLTQVPCSVGTNSYGEYNRLAGVNRNKDMGDNATHLVAFNLNTSGTNQMISYGEKIGIVVKEVKLY